MSIHVDLMLPTNEVEDDDSDDVDINDTTSVKMARLNYKLHKASLMRKLITNVQRGKIVECIVDFIGIEIWSRKVEQCFTSLCITM